MDALNEKRKTAANSRGEILDARVIANYGDPGLEEDYQFDLLSRYVIVMIESVYRVLTVDKWVKMLAVVQRPRHLWIETSGGVSGNPTTQKRADSQGNVNTGLAANFSARGIQSLNTPYALGETIKIRRLPTPLTQTSAPTFFQSDFRTWDSSISLYGAWHSEGSTIPYINSDAGKIQSLRAKTIEPVAGDTNGFFNFYLNKLQYETFMLSIGDSSLMTVMTQIFDGSWRGNTPVYSAHGGYLFQPNFFTQMFSCEYEDVNAGNKMRIGANDCIPLVVTTPNSFPTPKVRAAGTIAYNPSYSPISR
jgi:hypothetical protein